MFIKGELTPFLPSSCPSRRSSAKSFDVCIEQQVLPQLLLASPKNTLAGRCLSLLAAFVREEEKDLSSTARNSAAKYLRAVLSRSTAQSKDVRHQCLVFTRQVLEAFHGVPMDEGFAEYLSDVLLDLLSDRIVDVRLLAATSLAFLPSLPSTVDGLCEALDDMSSEVRVEVLKTLQAVGGWEHRMGSVAERCRDDTPLVRKHAFLALNSTRRVNRMTADDMRSAIVSGLQDADESVRLACSVWLLGSVLPHFGNNPEKLVQKISTVQAEQDMIIDALVKGGLRIPVDYFKSRIDELSPEAARLWLVCVRELPLESRERLLPSLPVFCTILEHYQSQPECFLPLCQLLACYDMSMHEAARESLGDTLRSILRDPDAEVTESIRAAAQQALKLLCDENDPLSWAHMCFEIIYDLVEEEDWIPALCIAQGLLVDSRLGLHVPGVAGLLESVLLPAVQSIEPTVRALAVRAMGCYCLLSVDLAVRYLLLFAKILNCDVEMVAVEASKVLFDFCIVFGAALLPRLPEVVIAELQLKSQCPGEQHPLLARLLAPLAEDDSSAIMYETAGVGLAKLLLHERLISPAQLGRAIAVGCRGEAYMETFLRLFISANPRNNVARLRRSLEQYAVLQIRGQAQGTALRALAAKWNIAWDSVAAQGLRNGGEPQALQWLCPSGGPANDTLAAAMIERAAVERRPEAMDALCKWAEARMVDLPLAGGAVYRSLSASSKKNKKQKVQAPTRKRSKKETLADEDASSNADSPAAPVVGASTIKKPKKKSVPAEVKNWSAQNADIDDFELNVEGAFQTPVHRAGGAKKRSRHIDLTGGDTGAESVSLATPSAHESALKRARDSEETPLVTSSSTNVSLVMCSGLSSSDKERAFAIVAKLGGKPCDANAFSTKVSHVVSSGNRSSKTLAAALCGSWVVSMDWILESEKCGHFVGEAPYGTRYVRAESPVFMQNTFITKEFARAAAEGQDGIDISLPSLSALLYSLGSARKVDTLQQADVVLTSAHHKRNGMFKHSSKVYTWTELWQAILKKDQ